MLYKNLVRHNPEILEHYGYFFHFYYEELIGKIPPKMLLRFLFLCCFMWPGEYLMESSCVPMNLKEIKKLLYLEEQEAQETIDFMLENRLIKIVENNFIKINSKYCVKMSPSHTKPHTRIFDKALTELYIMYEEDHDKLAKLYYLTPYINKLYNVCCYNPEEEDFDKLKFISLREIAEKLNIHKLKEFKEFEKFMLTITANDSVALSIRGDKENPFVMVNSIICFGGDLEALDELRQMHTKYLSVDFYRNLLKTL